MVIGEINAGSTPVVNNDTTPVRTEQPSAGRGTAIGRSADWTSTMQGKNRAELAQLQTVNDQANGIASQVRRDNQQLAVMGSVLGQMKNELYQIVKVYPPYPPGDSERIRFLRSFSGLRAEIDHLTIPPPGKWDGTLQEQSGGAGLAAATARQPAQTGFAIPRLSEQAGDQEVRTAFEKTAQAIATVVARQQRMADSAEQMQQARSQQKVSVISGASGGTWDVAMPGEQQAETLSIEIRHEIAGSSSTVTYGAQPQLAALAG
jgi:hypothetical protein